MKKLACWTALLLASSALLRAEEIQVAYAGKYRAPITGYKVGSSYFVTAKEAGDLYGGQVYWYPVAGRVQMSFRGKALQFLAEADTASSGDRTFRLDKPMVVRAAQALIPLSFFLSKEFSGWAGFESDFNAHTRLLTVDPMSTVGAVRFFSYADFTRLELELSPGLTYSAAARGIGGLDLTIPLGVIESSEEAGIGDGIVEGYALKQESRLARLRVAFARSGSAFRLLELAGPRRVVVEVYRAGKAPPPRAPAPAAGPEKIAAAPSPGPAVSTAPARPAFDSVPAVVTPAGRAKRRVVIDAGHGGKDSGAIGRRGTFEKDINLMAALELAKLLRQEDAFEVLLTRNDDTFVPLGDRSRLANEFGADLFISLHCNASTNKAESGFEVYFLSEQASDPEAARMAEIENSVLSFEGKSAEAEDASPILMAMTRTEHINAAAELAGHVSKALEKRLDIDDRGVKQAAFYVLRGTNAPAVLIEMAFVTNQKDETKLESGKYRRRVVDAVYAGLLNYARQAGWLDAERL